MRVSAEILTGFVAGIFEKSGSAPAEAETVARRLVAANLAGHDSHGVIRVPRYIDWIADGTIVPNQTPETVARTATFTVIDARNGFGQVMGEAAIDAGIALARAHGAGLIGLRNSGHLGRIGEWSERAAAADLASIIFVNVQNSRRVAPFNGLEARMSTNPIAFGIPVAGRPPIVLDMTSCAAAEGKFAVARNKGAPMPDGWLIDKRGDPTNDPNALYDGGAILPLAGHKGHGLAIVIDLMAGALIGGLSGGLPASHTANNMLAILFDPFRAGARNAISEECMRLIDWIQATPARPGEPILMPGDVERLRAEERLAAGIDIDETTWAQLLETGAKLGLSTDDLRALAAAD